ncbi:MAG: DUF2723 domain-containing protein [Nanoarchaeota archaeon]
MVLSLKSIIPHTDKLFPYWCGIFVFISSLLLYLRTLSPTVYWGDSGEFITVAHTLGVAHPTGYPTYTLLAHLFTLLPVGTIAFRVNLMSAFFAALAVMIVYFICYRLTKSVFSSCAAALFLAFSYALWSQAVIAEVHTLSAFFIALDIYFILSWKETNNQTWLYLFSLTYGLTLTNHLTTILLAPAFGYLIFFTQKGKDSSPNSSQNSSQKQVFPPAKILWRSIFLFLLGLTPYLYLIVRSSMKPIWNWGNIQTISQWMYHIMGTEYTTTGQFISGKFLLQNMYVLNESIVKTDSLFGLLIFLIPVAAVVIFIREPTYHFRMLALFSSLSAIPIIVFALNYNTDSSAFFLPVVLISVVLGGVFCSYVISSFQKNIKVLFSLVVGVLLLLLAMHTFTHNNISQDYSAEYYWRNIFESVPSGSLIIGEGTHDMFIPLYFQEVLGQYQDKAVVELSALTKPWALSYVEKHLHLSLPREGIVTTYVSEEEARTRAWKQVAFILEKSPQSTSIYTTISHIPLNYTLIPAGPLFLIDRGLPVPSVLGLLSEYPLTIVHEEGKQIVSQSLLMQALTDIQHKEYARAYHYAFRATQFTPDHFDAWNVLGTVSYFQNNTQGAIMAWERAITLQENLKIRKNLQILKS